MIKTLRELPVSSFWRLGVLRHCFLVGSSLVEVSVRPVQIRPLALFLELSSSKGSMGWALGSE